jgi:hypothetical protein
MAHYAKIENNRVSQVIVVNNEILLDDQGIEREEIGATFCSNLFGGEWIQTSYNGNFRGRFAGSGDFYDSDKDEFIAQVVVDETLPE